MVCYLEPLVDIRTFVTLLSHATANNITVEYKPTYLRAYLHIYTVDM